MSQAGDHIVTLREMIRKYPGAARAVVETFYDTVSNQEWDAKDIVDFLAQSKGISKEADKVLAEFIAFEKCVNPAYWPETQVHSEG